jgi:AAA+ superfamily predicted ATPase
MGVENITIIIDYSIMLFHEFNSFVRKNHFKSETNVKLSQNNQAFVVQEHSVWEYVLALKKFHPVDVRLTYEEKKYILLLLGASLYGQNGINIWQAACFFHRVPLQAMHSLSKVLGPSSGFMKSGMAMFQETDFLGTALSIEGIADFYNNRKVYLSPFALNSIFTDFTGRNLYGIAHYQLSGNYKDINGLLKDISNIMKYLFFLANFYKVNYAHASQKEDIYEKGEFAQILRKFKKNIIHSSLKLHLVEFLKQHDLSNIEFVVLLYLIYKVVISKEFIIANIEEVLSNFAFIPSQIKTVLNCFSKDSMFVMENFVGQMDFFTGYPFEDEIDSEEVEMGIQSSEEGEFVGIPSDYNAISISKDKIYRLVFSEAKQKSKKIANPVEASKSAQPDKETRQIQQEKGLYEIITPKVAIKNVILDEEVKNELLSAVDMTKTIDIMKSWEVKPNLASDSFSSIKILLYGPSGTGKTITAQALAGDAGADLFKVDASNLVSVWVGESTKNVKRVFKEFYKYAKGSSKRVFLFINEADQLLSARGNITQAADKEYNQMQNLLLEELENFDGVFIATTNLADLFDTAWNRRFNIKIRFDIPKYETRLKLWEVHISRKMPIAKDVDLRKLSEFELAGGSIANVVYNAARKAALRSVSPKLVTQKDFLDAIHNELKSHLGNKSARVGFST